LLRDKNWNYNIWSNRQSNIIICIEKDITNQYIGRVDDWDEEIWAQQWSHFSGSQFPFKYNWWHALDVCLGRLQFPWNDGPKEIRNHMKK